MSAKASYFRLGLFVIVGTLILLVGIVSLGVGEYFEERFQVETYFSDSIQGLSVGTPVKFRGVTIGDVERITFVQEVYERGESTDRSFGYVRIRFGIDYEVFPGLSVQQLRERLERSVQDGLRVRLASAGLMGTAYLSAEFLDPVENPPLELAWEPKRLYIPSAPSAFGAMMKSMEYTLNNLAQVDVKAIGENLNTLLVNADKQITDLQIATVREKAFALVDELRGTNARIKELLSKPELDQAIGDAGEAIAAIRDLIGESKQDLAAAIANASSATSRIDALLADERIDTIVDGLEQASGQLPPAVAQARRTLQTVNAILREEQQDLRIIIQNLRTISEGLARLSGEAQDNPSRILFGEPPPRGRPGG